MFSYIVATCARKSHTSNRDLAEDVLALNIEELLELLRKSKKAREQLKEVIIVRPGVHAFDRFEHYYRLDEWSPALKKFGVELKVVPYIGANEHHSYDQWIQGWDYMDATSRYAIMIEDDYALDVKHPDWFGFTDKVYKDVFPNDVGYLCTYVHARHHGVHAAISNGVVSARTIEFLRERGHPIKLFLDEKNSNYPQVNFSRMFLNNKVPIKDVAGEVLIRFWNSTRNAMEKYGPAVDHDREWFVPVQAFVDLENEK